MTRYQVDSDAVLSTAGGVRASIGRIEGEIAGLHGQLINLQGSWTGQAASAFQTVANEWRVTAQRVSENLTALNLALDQAGQTYADIELQNARRFGF